MPDFGAHSTQMLADAHPDLVRVFAAVVQHFDCTILNAIRTVEQQRQNVAKGLSQTMERNGVDPGRRRRDADDRVGHLARGRPLGRALPGT